MELAAPITDGRLVKGARTRQAILATAARLASSEGLEAVSLQRLATDLGISKSGLFAHFGSKEELQLATVAEAARVFSQEVLKPGLAAPRGLARVLALCDCFLSYVERDVFPGGCFFEAAGAEFDSRPGPVRDAIVEGKNYWSATIARSIRDAQAGGDIPGFVDPGQLAWELECFLVGANVAHVAGGTDAFGRAREAIRSRLEAARATD